MTHAHPQIATADPRLRARDPLTDRVREIGRPCAVETRIGDCDPTALLDRILDDTLVYWRDPAGRETVGVGTAHEIVAWGDDRFDRITGGAAAVLPQLAAVAVDGRSAEAPRMFAGFAFDTERRADGFSDWRAFPDAVAILPEVRLDRGPNGVRLGIVSFDGDSPRLRTRLARVRAAAAALPAVDEIAPVVERSGTSRVDYRDAVARVLRDIDAGIAEKVVVARRLDLLMATPVPLGLLVRRLRRRYPSCYVFAVRRRTPDGGFASFVGASPELLVEVRGTEARSEALAGTIEASRNDAALLDSAKDRVEHGLVVDHLTATLGPRLVDFRVDDEPTLRRLQRVVHLATGASGRLNGTSHVLRLVAALHPTPAVGGAPVSAARAWLRYHEDLDRGWYAGPIGWFDRDGDGAFAVGIRSGLVTDRRVSLFAGAGIVRGSDPEAELAETDVKLHALLDALDAR